MHIISAADFPLFCQILLENASFCLQNARLKNGLFCSKFCLKNLSKPGRWWSRCESDGPPFLMALVAVARKLKWGACSYAMQISPANDSMQHTIENNVISLKTMG